MYIHIYQSGGIKNLKGAEAKGIRSYTLRHEPKSKQVVRFRLGFYVKKRSSVINFTLSGSKVYSNAIKSPAEMLNMHTTLTLDSPQWQTLSHPENQVSLTETFTALCYSLRLYIIRSFSFNITVLLKYNSHTMEFVHLRCAVQCDLVFSENWVIFNHYHSQLSTTGNFQPLPQSILEHLDHPLKKPHTH